MARDDYGFGEKTKVGVECDGRTSTCLCKDCCSEQPRVLSGVTHWERKKGVNRLPPYQSMDLSPWHGTDRSILVGGSVVNMAILRDVLKELHNASVKFPKFNSAHEGYAVLLEEVDELWAEVKAKSADRSKNRMREEAIQVTAMGLRFLVDLAA